MKGIRAGYGLNHIGIGIQNDQSAQKFGARRSEASDAPGILVVRQLRMPPGSTRVSMKTSCNANNNQEQPQSILSKILLMDAIGIADIVEMTKGSIQ